MTPSTETTPAAACASPPRATPRRRAMTGSRAAVLGVAWLHGSMHASTFRRHHPVNTWSAGEPVDSMEDFAAALDRAIEATGFAGTEIFIILANEQFLHQVENVPSFSEKAARAYLRGRVERMEKTQESMLWVSQRAMSVRNEHAFLLHLLPGSFYYRLNEILISRRLDLTRILPVVVPLQLELARVAAGVAEPVLLAAEAGRATAVIAGRANGEVLFSRLTLASWADDPARVAVEVNRSLLYAKQQFGAMVDRAWLLGPSAETARVEIQTKCGADKKIIAESAGPLEWLGLVAKLSQRHPVNLVSGYLRAKRRNRMIRSAVLIACWLALAFLGVDTWSDEQSWHAERASLQNLREQESALGEEMERLAERNAAADRHRSFVRLVVDEQLPPVPGRFLGVLASTFPSEARLTDFVIKTDDGGDWTVKFDGEVRADEETARLLTASLRRQLERGPFRVRFPASAQGPSAIVIDGASTSRRFALEGDLFEN